MELANKYVDAVDRAIQLGEIGEPRDRADILKTLPGMSSIKGRMFLNNLLAILGKINYLEIGVWLGSTFCSALYQNKEVTGMAIDNFSQFIQSPTQKYPPRETFLENMKRFAPHGKFIEGDCWLVDTQWFPKFDVYFFDGMHDETSQYRAFTEYDSVLADTFIAIVDDWEFPPHFYDVQLGTLRAFKELGYSVVRQWILPKSEYYHEGMFVAVVRKCK